MDIQKISLRLSEILSGCILGGAFFCAEWLVYKFYLLLMEWTSNHVLAVWPFHILHGFVILSLLFLVIYSCFRPPTPNQKSMRTRLPHLIFLLTIGVTCWYFWLRVL